MKKLLFILTLIAMGVMVQPNSAEATEPLCGSATPEILTFAGADGCYTTTYGLSRICCYNNTCWTEHTVAYSSQWCGD